ncbi:MAG: response regulator, partial [Verrucomicrobiales bacterium]|nr:response regulator [Verrucomicrobiales bacterium]
PPPAPVLQGRRVLILDDSDTQRRAMASAIEALAPARLRRAGDVAAALEVLRESAKAGEPVDLILFDAELVESDVIHTARRLRMGGATGDLVALVPPGTLADARGLEAAGIRGTLVKPFRQSKLAEEIAAVLRGEAFAADGPTHEARDEKPGLGLRVLVVDDNGMNRRVVRGMLERMGAAADVASSGAEAIEACTSHRYDLVLMDCQMPEMDGYEATRRIRREETRLATAGSHPRRVPIVALSANALEGDRERGLEAGMDDYLTKPLRQPDLSRVLRNAAAEPAIAAGDSTPSDVVSPPTESVRPSRVPAASAGAPPGKEGNGEAETDVPVLDRGPLEAIADPDDPDSVAGFIRDYLREAPKRLEALEAAATAGDAARLKAEAHTLKGSSSYMGAQRLVRACGAVEAAARAGDLSAVSELVGRVREEFARAAEALAAYAGPEAGVS